LYYFTDTVGHFRAFTDNSLRFHIRVAHIFSDAIILLAFIRSATFSLSFLGKILKLQFTGVISKAEYACIVWSLITYTDTNELERIQRMFLSLFNFVSKYRNCLVVRCASPVYKIASDMGVFRQNIISEQELLN